jgi:exonuclease
VVQAWGQHQLEVVAMACVMVDVESDGPIPGDYSMICFGAVVVQEGLERTFYGRLRPISDKWLPDALAVSGFTRDDTLGFDDPKAVMEQFGRWIDDNAKGRPLFVSDNNGFDWQFINWYFWHFTGGNPFGHSSTNLGSLYKGMVKDMFQNFKHLRKTEHTHHPVDDARGNAEALLAMKAMGLKIAL